MSDIVRRKDVNLINSVKSLEIRMGACNSSLKLDLVVIMNYEVIVNLAIQFVQIAHHLRKGVVPDFKKVETWFRYGNVQKDRPVI